MPDLPNGYGTGTIFMTLGLKKQAPLKGPAFFGSFSNLLSVAVNGWDALSPCRFPRPPAGHGHTADT